jgi:hypothetical protein
VINVSLEKLIVAFAQNLAEPIDGFLPLPIGLENKWRATHGKVLNFRFRRCLLTGKIPKIMWTFTIATNPRVRIEAVDALKKVDFAVDLGTLTPMKHRKYLAKYSFVACPPGNGLDTHRAWEALYLDTIPIVLKSAMTKEFSKLGIPMWVVNSYEEIANFDELTLTHKYKELKSGFDSKQLWIKWWFDRINEFKKVI